MRRKRLDANGTIHYLGAYEWNVGNGSGGPDVVSKYYYASFGKVSRLVAFRKGGALYYVGTDHLGSTVRVADASFAPVDQMRYRPYGVSRDAGSSLNTDHRFTSQIEDAAISLYWYKSRAYDPAIGRFVAPDTVVPDPKNPQALNRYSYVLNNPLRYTDPTGYRLRHSEGDEGGDGGDGSGDGGSGGPETEPTPTPTPGPTDSPDAPSPGPAPTPTATATPTGPGESGEPSHDEGPAAGELSLDKMRFCAQYALDAYQPDILDYALGGISIAGLPVVPTRAKLAGVPRWTSPLSVLFRALFAGESRSGPLQPAPVLWNQSQMSRRTSVVVERQLATRTPMVWLLYTQSKSLPSFHDCLNYATPIVRS